MTVEITTKSDPSKSEIFLFDNQGDDNDQVRTGNLMKELYDKREVAQITIQFLPGVKFEKASNFDNIESSDVERIIIVLNK